MVLIASSSSSASVMVDLLPRVSIAWPLARGNRCACFPGDEGFRASSNRGGIDKHFDLHASSALRHRRIVPAARRRDILVLFARPPATHFLFVDGYRRLQNRIADP